MAKTLTDKLQNIENQINKGSAKREIRQEGQENYKETMNDLPQNVIPKLFVKAMCNTENTLSETKSCILIILE
jgi:hypothetical protein